ncbi:hypothetical protein WN944_022487 [Citrus x changshan-huyou]|uniref:Uncharacterized protein n=1 Tax=Citrus x changshan-huyou TaxID=2935761 RepID=A0AAP0N4E1_9ROSI
MPEGLKALVNLKCLNLEYTFDLIKIPRKLISNFSRLHVLRLFGHAITSVLYGGDELIVKELLGLKHLEAVLIEKSKNGLQISKDKVDGLANFKRQGWWHDFVEVAWRKNVMSRRFVLGGYGIVNVYDTILIYDIVPKYGGDGHLYLGDNLLTVEASSSSLSARTTVTNAKFKVEKFDGTNNFGMWQYEVLDVLCQQELDITLEEKPDKMDDKE